MPNTLTASGVGSMTGQASRERSHQLGIEPGKLDISNNGPAMKASFRLCQTAKGTTFAFKPNCPNLNQLFLNLSQAAPTGVAPETLRLGDELGVMVGWGQQFGTRDMPPDEGYATIRE